MNRRLAAMRPVTVAAWSTLALVLAAVSVPVRAMQAIGEARSVDTGELRYTEHHHCSDSGAQCEVEYRDARGEVFARKQLDYSRSMHAPTLVLEHLREGNTVRVQGELEEALVVDAGFDHYLRTHWNALARGERIVFEFLPAGRGSPLSMRAQKEEGKPCPQPRMCFKVSMDNWLLGAVVPPIHLQYSRQNKRLLRYHGISNLRDGQGEQQQVRIDYRYPSSGEDAEELSL
jgi:hypothetical protein